MILTCIPIRWLDPEFPKQLAILLLLLLLSPAKTSLPTCMIHFVHLLGGKINLSVGILQLIMKKRFVCGAIAFVWTVIPAIEIAFTVVSTDIIQGKCMGFAVYKSHAMKKSIGFFSVFVTYLLPLALMVFCYARIVHALRTKVIVLHCHNYVWLGGRVVRTLDLRSIGLGREFESWPLRYRVQPWASC